MLHAGSAQQKSHDTERGIVMKRLLGMILIFSICLSLCACGGNAVSQLNEASVPEDTAGESSHVSSFSAGASVYIPGICLQTDFGEITVLDAAFCAKAQLIDALPQPAYQAAGDGRIVFAMRVQITNTTGSELVLMDDLKVSIHYGGEHTFGCSKGGNYKSSDPLYKYLPAGVSGEYIICGRVPVDVYQSAQQFCVLFNDTPLGFSYENIQLYQIMGYQDGDNLLTSREALIASAGTAPAEAPAAAPSGPAANPAFSLEDTRYEMTDSGITVEVKIRNIASVSIPSIVCEGVILDANGDILENCSCVYRNGLEAGQAGWASIRISDPATLEEMESIKFITIWYKEDPQSPSHNLRFDLPEPFVIDIQGLQAK